MNGNYVLEGKTPRLEADSMKRAAARYAKWEAKQNAPQS
jgi:hypothetical protein